MKNQSLIERILLYSIMIVSLFLGYRLGSLWSIYTSEKLVERNIKIHLYHISKKVKRLLAKENSELLENISTIDDMYYQTLPDDIYGVCRSTDNPFTGTKLRRSIKLDPIKVLNDGSFRAVLAHEYLHCALGMDHYEEDVDLMNSRITQPVIENPNKYLKKAINRYIKENSK